MAKRDVCTDHCVSCGRHFNSTGAFDAHFAGEFSVPRGELGSRHCADPRYAEPALRETSGHCRLAHYPEIERGVAVWSLA